MNDSYDARNFLYTPEAAAPAKPLRELDHRLLGGLMDDLLLRKKPKTAGERILNSIRKAEYRDYVSIENPERAGTKKKLLPANLSVFGRPGPSAKSIQRKNDIKGMSQAINASSQGFTENQAAVQNIEALKMHRKGRKFTDWEHITSINNPVKNMTKRLHLNSNGVLVGGPVKTLSLSDNGAYALMPVVTMNNRRLTSALGTYKNPLIGPSTRRILYRVGKWNTDKI